MDERIDILTTVYVAEQTFDAGDVEQLILHDIAKNYCGAKPWHSNSIGDWKVR